MHTARFDLHTDTHMLTTFTATRAAAATTTAADTLLQKPLAAAYTHAHIHTRYRCRDTHRFSKQYALCFP
jgi:hypothetical protein